MRLLGFRVLGVWGFGLEGLSEAFGVQGLEGLTHS